LACLVDGDVVDIDRDFDLRRNHDKFCRTPNVRVFQGLDVIVQGPSVIDLGDDFIFQFVDFDPFGSTNNNDDLGMSTFEVPPGKDGNRNEDFQ